MSANQPKILLTGVTGYIGGRLRSRLEARGTRLRCLARTPRDVAPGASDRTEIVEGDVLEPESLTAALEGIETAYYLVHSMTADGDFEALDRTGAENFARAARDAGVKRIVYLGGLGRGEDLSPHLRSRQEVGEVFRSSGVPVIELRASIVIGAGSLSFEMVRALVERLPIMITPKWVEVQAQPIAIRDLLDYLEQSLDVELEASRIVEIGGRDRVSYGDLMREYARQRRLSRWMIKVPVLTPRLSSLWLGFVTPLYAHVGRSLLESIRHPTVVEEPGDASELFRSSPMGMQQALAEALADEEDQPIDSKELAVAAPERPAITGVRIGNRMVDSRSIRVAVSPELAFAPIRRIGGETGWYAYDWLWRVRGFIDVLLGGEGMSPSRTDAEVLEEGDRVDCWRVASFEMNRRLVLEAEMKLPGRAWLQFDVEAVAGGTRIRQTATFDPHGLLGLAYWYLVCPLHWLVFAGMLKGIAHSAENGATTWRAA